MRATSHTHCDAALSGGMEDVGNAWVKGEGFAPLVLDSGVGVFGFDGRSDVGVDPEGPERVVEVEDYDAWEGEGVEECFGPSA